ncbi:helix-turn-helix domain-containing protein [Microbacterium sp. SD291]|uniref:helix-turn-helix domain-containing protein n=1 Tax=Microbacterium sp. SD291 TaxID=2782007 RepID=UPI001A97A0A3|nr:helix-turn-helix domain-containing protein [Microbacterium sp. SD291]MBO0980185.1 helix-turn-helix domain-containing protein [Microbacterium sp. SD291]
MQTIQTSGIPAEQLDALERFAAAEAGAELRDVIMSLQRCLREGGEIAILDLAAVLTPSQAAERLGLSRTHLYKLLDRGEIVSHRVGRDRRIRVVDLVDFERQRQHGRRELAERFGNQQTIRDGAIDELAELL